MSIKTVVANPFYLYSIVWGSILVLYILHYSDLYPEIGNELVSFLLFTLLVSFFIGYRLRRLFIYTPIVNFNISKIKRWLGIFLFLFIVECLSERFVPIIPLLLGNVNMDIRDFGFPIIHVVLCNGLSFLALYSYHCYRSTSNKLARCKLRNYILLSVTVGILLINRSMLMTIGIGILLIYLLSSSKPKKAFFLGVLLATGGFYFFGVLGNLRIDREKNENMILKIGLATETFKESIIPSEFFWGYLYMTSPLSNLQNTVERKVVPTSIDLKSWLILELLPETVSNNIKKYFSLEEKSPDLVFEALNVSTFYASSYAYLGWFGLFAMFTFMIFYVLISLLLIPRSSPLFVLGFIYMSIIIILNVFDNMFTYIGIVPQVFIIVILSYNRFRQALFSFIKLKK